MKSDERAETYNAGFGLFTFKTGMRIKTSEGRRELNGKIGVHSTQLAMQTMEAPANTGGPRRQKWNLQVIVTISNEHKP